MQARVKLKLRGLNELMKSAPVQSDVAKRAARIAQAAGEGFEAVVKPGRYTARAFVRTSSQVGRERQANEATLQRALDAGR